MDNVIQCPTCSKKYRLKGPPPPTFQCRNCNTLMDLSGYAAPAVPAVPAAPAASGRRAARASGAPSPRRGAAGRRRPNAAAGRHRRGRQEEAYDDEGGDERPRYSRGQKGPNNALIFGSLGALVIAGILLMVVLRNQPEPEPEKPKEVVQQPQLPIVPEGPDEVEEPPKEAPKPPPGREDEKRPELAAGSLESIPIPEGKRKYRYSQAEIKTYPWPDYVTGEERAQIEKWIEALQWSGADGRDAAEALVEMDCRLPDGTLKPGDQFKGVGRLISEFRNTLDRHENDLTNPDCLAMLSALDKILRRIDGFLERDYNDRRPIHFQSTDKEAELTIKRWNWWYDLEKWRMRREPWDEAEDLADPETMEGDDWTDEDK